MVIIAARKIQRKIRARTPPALSADFTESCTIVAQISQNRGFMRPHKVLRSTPPSLPADSTPDSTAAATALTSHASVGSIAVFGARPWTDAPAWELADEIELVNVGRTTLRFKPGDFVSLWPGWFARIMFMCRSKPPSSEVYLGLVYLVAGGARSRQQGGLRAVLGAEATDHDELFLLLGVNDDPEYPSTVDCVGASLLLLLKSSRVEVEVISPGRDERTESAKPSHHMAVRRAYRKPDRATKCGELIPGLSAAQLAQLQQPPPHAPPFCAELEEEEDAVGFDDDACDVACGKCGDRTAEHPGRGVMLLCDTCGGGTHLRCCLPPLERVPGDDTNWFCAVCAWPSETVVRRKQFVRRLSRRPVSVPLRMPIEGCARAEILPRPSAILTLLRCMAVKFPSASRAELMHTKQCGNSPPVAVTLGAVAHVQSCPCMSLATRQFPGLARSLCALGRGAIARGHSGPISSFTTIQVVSIGVTWEDCVVLIFVALQVNLNCRMKLHVDKSNSGPSFAIALGNFTGGALFVSKRGDLDVHNRWVVYDGNTPHRPRRWVGERFIIVFFTTRGARMGLGASEHTPPTRLHRELTSHGFPLPESLHESFAEAGCSSEEEDNESEGAVKAPLGAAGSTVALLGAGARTAGGKSGSKSRGAKKTQKAPPPRPKVISSSTATVSSAVGAAARAGLHETHHEAETEDGETATATAAARNAAAMAPTRGRRGSAILPLTTAVALTPTTARATTVAAAASASQSLAADKTPGGGEDALNVATAAEEGKVRVGLRVARVAPCVSCRVVVRVCSKPHI